MKKFIILLIFSFIIFSCKKEESLMQEEQTFIEEPLTQTTSSTCVQTSFVEVDERLKNRLISVFFVDERVGFVTGYGGEIYKTTDFAKTWTLLNSTTDLPIRDIYFLDSKNGFAIGGENSCGGSGCTPPGGFILKTKDGGQTWIKVYTTLNKLEITSMYFINDKVGFCVGDNVIYKTTDGGKSWTEKQVNNLRGKMMQVKFSDDKNGIIVCLFDKILKTTDGGENWQLKELNKNRGYYSLSSSNGATYISGQGKMLKSIDNGISWNELENSPNEIYELHFTNENIGYAFGSGNYSGGDFGYLYGSIYCTNDGGNSWNGSSDFRDVGLIEAISFPSKKRGYAASGRKVVKIIVE